MNIDFIEEMLYTLNKFNWKMSALDARAINFLNTWGQILQDQRKAWERDALIEFAKHQNTLQTINEADLEKNEIQAIKEVETYLLNKEDEA